MRTRLRAWGRLTATGMALVAGSAGSAELVVEWAPMKAAVDAFQVERRGDAESSFESIARVAGETTRFVDHDVTAGERYCYRVRGLRGERSSPPSAELCSMAVEPPSPDVDPAPRPTVTVPPPVQDREARPLRRPPPQYPREARLRGLSGWVRLRFTVTAEGATRDVEVLEADPPGVFDQAAIDAAQRFLYAPRLENGVPVDRPNVETEITFTWIDRGGELSTGRPSPGPR